MVPDKNPYAHHYAEAPEAQDAKATLRRELEKKERHRKRRKKVARDGAERGASIGPIIGIIAAVAVQYGLDTHTAAFLTQPATIAALTAILVWVARIAEALIADARSDDLE